MMYCNYIILYVDSTDRAAINTKTLQWEIASLTFLVFLFLQSSYKDKATRTLVVFSRNFVISGYLSMITALNLLENNSVNRIPFPTSSKFLRHQNIHSRLVFHMFNLFTSAQIALPSSKSKFPLQTWGKWLCQSLPASASWLALPAARAWTGCVSSRGSSQ